VRAAGKRIALVYVHFALSSGVTCRTETLVRFNAINTLPTVHARAGIAFLFVMARKATVTRSISVVAVAFNRAIRTQLAGSPIFVALCALFRSARLDRVQASVALPHVVHPIGETIGASARVTVDALDTDTAVRAGRRFTLVDVNGACIPIPPRSAEAVESMVLCVVYTRTVVLARHGFTSIEFQIAVHTSVKLSTGAIVSVDPISTPSPFPAGRGRTLIYICFA
jgi:hypothetical protein